MYSDTISAINGYCVERPDYGGFLNGIAVKGIRDSGCERLVFVENRGEDSPSLFVFNGLGGGSERSIIPYYLIRDDLDRNIISYNIGRGICNLSEVREVSGALYSRCSESYDENLLPQQDGLDSKIALWIHDCLTGDFDHGRRLNRRELASGITLSYDFGKCFTSTHFPVNYAGELGLDGESIAGRLDLVIDQLRKYSRIFLEDGGAFVSKITESYPETGSKEKLLRYFKCFKDNFPMRLYYGRIFDYFPGRPFDKGSVRDIFDSVGIDTDSVVGWESLISLLSECQSGCYDGIKTCL
ncbi:MAG: hypothetical protein JW984_12375 [Deltaproteobacteria bacterium]|uniref:Uncharacterized protein n=1 Tax=Candidatus Zymogenus saltonus TaxID=2844893 RepID=A0A9D8KGE3_9DELT|nr:hypothetical protein [Candidatus Zymogenus saltonus]